jgi:D-3-phosphoglycerate dehydrogenase
MPFFLLTARITEPGMKLLAAHGEVAVLPTLKGPEAAPLLAKADALIARTETVDRALIAAGTRLRIIVRHGVGYDNIDVAAASEMGIPVAYLPGINSDAVAEHVFGLLMELTKRNTFWSARIRAHDWRCRLEHFNVGLAGKTLGVVGLGNIGRMVAKRAPAFDMKVVGYDPYVTPEAAAALGVTKMELDPLLAAADFVTLHTPGTSETKNLIDADRIARMKPGACLINTARGTLVDLAALDAALTSGHLAGAGLDVFPVEPPDFAHPIFANPKAVITPHIASNTRETIDKQGLASAQAAIDGVNGVKPAALANPAIWPPRKA